MAKFKEGDIVWCKPGYEEGNEGDDCFGGSGYWPGRIFVIKAQTDDRRILWPSTGFENSGTLHPKCAPIPSRFIKEPSRINNGVYEHAVEIYTNQNIDLYDALETIKKEIYER